MVRIVCVLAALAGIAFSSLAQSQQYPARPIRIVMGFPAGGPTDAAGRIIAQALAQRVGQSVVVDNRPGADGTIGPDVVSKATPDGHTLLMAGSSNMSGVYAFRKNPPYDPLRDFVPITFIGWTSLLLVVNPALPVKSVSELVSHARANPGKVVLAAANPPTIMVMAHINSAAKVEMLSVGYKGDAAAVPDLLAGRAHVLGGGTNLLLPYVRDGRMRALASLTRARTKPAPDIPTIVEAGVANYSTYGWFVMYAPAKAPPAVVERLEREINAVLKAPEVLAQFEKIGLETGGGPSRSDLPAFLKEQTAAWTSAARAAGIQPQ